MGKEWNTGGYVDDEGVADEFTMRWEKAVTQYYIC